MTSLAQTLASMEGTMERLNAGVDTLKQDHQAVRSAVETSRAKIQQVFEDAQAVVNLELNDLLTRLDNTTANNVQLFDEAINPPPNVSAFQRRA